MDTKNGAFFKTMTPLVKPKVSVFISVSECVSADDRRKSIKKCAFSNEMHVKIHMPALVCSAPLISKIPESNNTPKTYSFYSLSHDHGPFVSCSFRIQISPEYKKTTHLKLYRGFLSPSSRA